MIPGELKSNTNQKVSISANLLKHSGLREKVIDNIRLQTISKADLLMKAPPVTVTASLCKRSAGGKNDFYSEGDYWWPDPANPTGP
jgi:hypothetical protein